MNIFMKIPFVDLSAQYSSIKSEIDAAIADVIAQSAFIRGPHVESFEKAWAETAGVKHCISCANGTDAIYITMKALEVKPGDEVITTAHSWISCDLVSNIAILLPRFSAIHILPCASMVPRRGAERGVGRG